jgi:predicted ATPase
MTRQRLRLQTAYGSALLHGRGMQSPETHKAFSRAQELATGSDDPSARFSIRYALWAGHFVRGELAPLREIAGLALHEVEGRPDSPEAVVALRLNGATEWFAGNFTGARAFLERARAIFDPQRHSDNAYRFAQDIGVSIAAYLALVLWALGEVDQARAVAEEGAGRAIRTGHVSTIGYAHFHFAVFEMLRRSISASAPHIKALVNVSRTHEMEMWTAYAKFFALWLRCGADGTDAVLTEMRDSIATLREQGVGNYVPFLTAALAEVEAQAGQGGQALATIDGVIGDSERSGQRWFDAETYRVRGGVLLKRDAVNTAPAEEAFLAAIAIAQQQKARSFELRAALSLAKLYHSNGRLADAHDVIAPVLEGFSPTSEMPEIGEAGALLQTLEGDEAVKSELALRDRRVKLQLAYGAALISARLWCRGNGQGV